MLNVVIRNRKIHNSLLLFCKKESFDSLFTHPLLECSRTVLVQLVSGLPVGFWIMPRKNFFDIYPILHSLFSLTRVQWGEITIPFWRWFTKCFLLERKLSEQLGSNLPSQQGHTNHGPGSTSHSGSQHPGQPSLPQLILPMNVGHMDINQNKINSLLTGPRTNSNPNLTGSSL